MLVAGPELTVYSFGVWAIDTPGATTRKSREKRRGALRGLYAHLAGLSVGRE
jgi:hypothetical protein